MGRRSGSHAVVWRPIPSNRVHRVATAASQMRSVRGGDDCHDEQYDDKSDGERLVTEHGWRLLARSMNDFEEHGRGRYPLASAGTSQRQEARRPRRPIAAR